MTTQPSDWDVIALEVARRFTQDTEPQRRANLQVAVIDAIKRARELDASGGGVEPVAWISPRGDLIDNERFQSRLNGLPDFGDLSGYRPLYATPRAAEAGDKDGEYRAHDRIEFALRDAGFDPATAAAMTAACERALDNTNAGDTERLNWIERTYSGMTNRERYLPVQMIWGKGANGRTLREAIDKYMRKEAAMGAVGVG